MTLQDYEDKYYDKLVDNYDGSLPWFVYVNRCYQAKLDSIDEAKTSEWENSR